MAQESRKPIASVVIPTYNRAQSLKRSLESVAALDLSPDLFEVVIVDNNCTDETPQVVESFKKRGMSIKYVKESRLSFTVARHAGVKAAQGRILAYIDDDVVVDKKWLGAVVEAFEADEKVGIVGGPILPEFEEEPPDWIKKDFLMSGWLSLLDRGPELHETNDAYGPNFSVRKDVVEEVGGFPADTIGVEANGRPGVVEKIYVGNGDVGLSAKVKKAGYKIIYAPAALTHHVIPPVRLTKKWWHSRLAGEGCCNAMTHQYEYDENRIQLAMRALRSTLRAGKKGVGRVVRQSGNEERAFQMSYHISRAKVEFALARRPDLARRLWDVALTGVPPQDINKLVKLLP